MFRRGREARPEIDVSIDKGMPYICIKQGTFDGGEAEVHLTEEEAVDVVRWLQEALAELAKEKQEE